MTFSNLPAVIGDSLVIDTRDQVKNAYLVHSDGTTTSVLSYMNWSNADLSLPLKSGSNAIAWSSYGEYSPLVVEMLTPLLSA